MDAPPHKARKALTSHGTETVELQEVIETVGRKVGYGSIKPKWQKYEEGVDKGAQSIRELRQTGREG